MIKPTNSHNEIINILIYTHPFTKNPHISNAPIHTPTHLKSDIYTYAIYTRPIHGQPHFKYLRSTNNHKLKNPHIDTYTRYKNHTYTQPHITK